MSNDGKLYVAKSILIFADGSVLADDEAVAAQKRFRSEAMGRRQFDQATPAVRGDRICLVYVERDFKTWDEIERERGAAQT